jgi:hypothetical protein
MIDSVVRSVHDQVSRSGLCQMSIRLWPDAQLKRKLRRILRRIARHNDSESSPLLLSTPLITCVLHG